MHRAKPVISFLLAAIAVALFPAASPGGTISFSLPGDTGSDNSLNMGFFPGGEVLSVSASGIVNLAGDSPPETWLTNPDGSLAAPVTAPYLYANVGATGYPTVGGGDGINHYPGGGANYDDISNEYGFAGAITTDTTDPLTIRVGCVVGTFASDPSRSDWFSIGDGTSVVVPPGGADLYLAVNDSYSLNDTGAYSGSIAVVPEPSSVVLLGFAAIGFAVVARPRMRKQRA